MKKNNILRRNKQNLILIKFIPLVFLFLIVGCTNQIENHKCLTGNYDEERDCFTALAYDSLNIKICEKMPEDNNERQANKAFCFGFLASIMGNDRICRDQKNDYYKNYCMLIFNRYFMSFDSEFEELKEQYCLDLGREWDGYRCLIN
jgi:hypothetical protein